MLRNTRWTLLPALFCSLSLQPGRAAERVPPSSMVQAEPVPETCIPVVGGVFAVKDTGEAQTASGMTMPTVIPDSRVLPRYPASALESEVAGKIQVRGVVCRDGSIEGVHAVKAPSPELGNAAVEAVKQWRFHPAMKDGEPVAVRYVVSLDVKP
jgi:TonB family protein